MRGNKKQSIAQSKKYVVVPKKEFKKLVEIHVEWAKSTIGLKRDMRKIIEEEVTKQFDNKKIMLEGLYKEILIEKRLLQKKGQIKQEDINKMYEELKKKNG